MNNEMNIILVKRVCVEQNLMHFKTKFISIFQILSNNGNTVGVITFLPEVFCNGSFNDYINVNASDNIIGNMTDKLCNLTTTTKQLDMTKLFLEEMDLDKLVHLVSTVQSRVIVSRGTPPFVGSNVC